jgi:hypothetical protein
MMSGQIQRSSSVVIGVNGSPANNSLSISPTTAIQSPLQIFVRAKKRINDIYGEVEQYVNDSCKFLLGNTCLSNHKFLIQPSTVNLYLKHIFFFINMLQFCLKTVT